MFCDLLRILLVCCLLFFSISEALIPPPFSPTQDIGVIRSGCRSHHVISWMGQGHNSPDDDRLNDMRSRWVVEKEVSPPSQKDQDGVKSEELGSIRARKRRRRQDGSLLNEVAVFVGTLFENSERSTKAALYERQIRPDKDTMKRYSPKSSNPVTKEEILRGHGIQNERTGNRWEERAEAFSMMPPPGVNAWGPTGDLGIEARELAIKEAQEKLEMAEKRLVSCKIKTERAREDILILRANKKVMRRSVQYNDGEDTAENFRELNRQIESASRVLSVAVVKEQRAQSDFENMKESYSVLTFHDDLSDS